MLKFLKFSERFFHHQKIKFPKSFSSLQNLNFQNFYPLIKDLKNSETYEFKLQPESKDGSPVIFEILKTHTIEDFFSKFSENLEYKSLKAYSLDQIELSNKTLISHLENSNFYVLADEKHLFKVIDATKGNMKQENEIEKYCVEMDISYLQKNILVNYLSRLDILNEIKFGAKFFNNNENNNKLIDKDELIQNLVEALPSNRTSLVFHEEGLLNQYRLIKEEVEDLQNQKEQLEKIAHKTAKRKMTLGLFALFGQLGFVGYGTYVFYSWDIIEPMVYFIGLGASILLGAQYFKLNNQYNNDSFFEYLKKRDFNKICVRRNFNMTILKQKQADLENLEKFLHSNILLSI